MALVPELVTQQRHRVLATANGSSSHPFGQSRQRPPVITYGRQDTRPLSLTARQFRPDIYAILSDDGGEDDGGCDGETALLEAGDDQNHSEDSELSDAEPKPQDELTEGDDVLEMRNKSKVPEKHALVPASAAPAHTARSKIGPIRPIRTPRTEPAYHQETPASRKAKFEIPIGSHGKATTKHINTKSKRNASPVRRLPVNELFLVNSPVDYDLLDPESDSHGIETQDPIDAEPSSPRKRSTSPVNSSGGGGGSKAPEVSLSAFRKYFKKPRLHCNALDARQRVQTEYDTLGSVVDTQLRGDGFDASELSIQPHNRVKKRCKRREPLILGFGSLQLRSGLLPNVVFESSSIRLKMETLNRQRSDPDTVDRGDALGRFVSAPEQRPKRRDSSIAQAREDLIRAQLSLISAPERMPSDSEDSEENLDEGIDEEDQQDHDQPLYDNRAEDDPEVANEPDFSDPNQPNIARQPLNQRKDGVTLDFRKRAPGQPPRPSLGGRSLIEVNEVIVQVPDSEHYQAEDTSEITARQASWTRPQACDMPVINRQQPHRPRSILKNSTQIVPDSTTRPEATEANTRRNSMINAAESQYFSDAANSLRSFDPARHIVIPRRRSSHGLPVDVEVADSERAVLEGSLEPLDYTNLANLEVLRRSSEAAWTSSLPAAPKGLNSLTKSVSREHGTLSQSVKRKPSLPFRSPTKIR